jgi:DNA-binding MarR family transcriptional regulator
MDQTTVSRNLDRLDDLGLIARAEDPEDARAARLTLTAAGRQILRDALPVWRAGQQQIRDAIGGPAADHLVSTASGLSGPAPD